MRKGIIALVAAISVAIVACGSGGVKSERSVGEKLFRANCNSCHILPKANKHTDEEWPTLVNRYANFTKLDELQRLEIIGYLQSVN